MGTDRSMKESFANNVKGYCVLEPLIRQKLIKKGSYEGEVRLTMGHLAKMFDIYDPLEASDDASKALMSVACSAKTEAYLQSACRGLKAEQVKAVSEVLERLRKFRSLIEYVTIKLVESKDLKLSGLFDPFP